MPLTKANSTVLDVSSIQGTGSDQVASGNHDHNLIDSNTDWYISPSGNDTSGDGSMGTPWATLGKAFTVLSNQRIADVATLNINVANGIYTSATELSLNHPDGDRINIIGDTPVTMGITSLVSYTGVAGNWRMTFDLDADPNAYTTIGEFVIVRDISSSDYAGHLLKGCFEVTNLTVSTIELKSTTQKTTIPSGTYTGNVTFIPTQFKFTADTRGFVVEDGFKLNSISDIVAVNTSGASTNDGITIKGSTSIDGEVGISGFVHGLYCDNGLVYSLDTGNLTSSNCTNGIYVINSGSVLLYTATLTSNSNDGASVINCSIFRVDNESSFIGNTSSGIYTFQSSAVHIDTTSVSAYNGLYGYNSNSSTMYLIWATAAYNGNGTSIGAGFVAHHGSSMLCNNAYSIGHYVGYESNSNSIVDCQSSQAHNGYFGFYAHLGRIFANSSLANNNYINFISNAGGYTYATLTTATNPGSTNYSPTINTVGNSNSYILK